MSSLSLLKNMFTRESLIINLMSGRALLLLTIAALGLVSPAPINAWQLDASGLARVPVPLSLHESQIILQYFK